MEANTYAEIANAKVRVIPLRFASVGETTRQFHGRSVTVPGISDTLKAIIGDLNIGGDAGAANARAGESDAAFERRVSQLARPRISIDRRTNSVIVRGSPGDVATIAQVIRELDQPLKMIEIEVIIATASLGVAEELGQARKYIWNPAPALPIELQLWSVIFTSGSCVCTAT